MGNLETQRVAPRLRPEDLRYSWRWPKYDFAYIGVPKCGSVSMRKAFGCRGGLPREEVLSCSHRWAVIRDPVDRIVSAHRYGWAGIPFGDWWREVKKNPSFDVHTQPFTESLRGYANRIVCIEDIDHWWPELRELYPVPAKPPHENKRRGGYEDTSLTAEQVWEICKLYREDLMLWENSRCCCSQRAVL